MDDLTLRHRVVIGLREWDEGNDVLAMLLVIR
jgi:hypothetical protein